ncbi:MAG: hypothetical protein E7257_08220 [Lachnospiraceae bacterium]|nr:hypothetical protein [Lachnospiraceae bacterium]
MPNILQKIVYNLSIIAPLLIMTSIVWIIQNNTYCIPILLISISISIIIGFKVSFRYAMKHMAPIIIRTEQISPHDEKAFSYLPTYLLPFASIVIKEFNLIILFCISLLIICGMIFCNTAFPNPVLMLGRYHFYQVSANNGVSNYLLISKQKYRSKKQLNSVYRMMEFLLIDSEEVE